MKNKTRAAFLPVSIILCGGLVLGLAASAAPYGQSGGGKTVKDIAVVDISADKDDCRLWVTYQNKGTVTIQATLRERTSVQGVGVVEDTFSAFNLPPGQYFGHGVGADPGYKIFGINRTVTTEIDVDNALAEINESNNTLTKTLSCSLLHPTGPVQQAPPKPDLVIPYIKFVVVKEGDDAGGHYVIFNAIVYVKNVGQGGVGPFNVLLEHQINGEGPYLTCATCKIPVSGLSAGQGLELPARQYNKRGTQTSGQAIFFRATADCDNARVETDETNNVYKDSYQGQSGHK
jgi:hypothetical protein